MDHHHLVKKKQEDKFKDAVESLTSMFGKVLSHEVLCTVLENCNGDVHKAVDDAMSLAEGMNVDHNGDKDTHQMEKPEESPALVSPITQQNDAIQSPSPTNQAPKTSYASTAVAKNTGAVPKILPKTPNYIEQPSWHETKVLSDIAKNHKFGNRTLILMRGPPGSGKTFLAKQVIDKCISADRLYYKRHIFSTDDFFLVRGVYKYNKSKLPEAHDWNQTRVEIALKQGVSPVIVDNTNVERWEMQFYVEAGVNNGYIIEVLEPKTPWAKNPNHLAKKNQHNVPIHTIKKMLNNFSPISGTDLISSLKLAYPTGMFPPVKRTAPPIDQSPVDAETIIEKNGKYSLENNASLSQCGNQSDIILPLELISSSNPTTKKDNNPFTKRDVENAPKNVSEGENQIEKDEARHMALSRQLAHILSDHAPRTEEENIQSYPLLYTNLYNVLSFQNSDKKKQETEYEVNLYKTMIACLQDIFEAEKNRSYENPNNAAFLQLVKSINHVACMTISNPSPPVPVVNSNNNEKMDGDNESFSEIKKQLVDINYETPETQNKKLIPKLEVVEQQLENILKVDDEWERGEAWGEVKNKESVKDINNSETNPKPPRYDKNKLDSVAQCEDWNLFMPPLHDHSKNKPIDIKIPVPTTASASTCIESGDTDLKKVKPNLKILTGKPKDINFNHVPAEDKIPLIRMFDKSTVTNEFKLESSGAYRCKNEEQHFKSLRKMFKNLPRAELRDIFKNCRGDVNWAVDIILEEVACNQLMTVEDVSDSDPEESGVLDTCPCLAAYNIIPSYDVDETVMTEKDARPEKTDDTTTHLQNVIAQKKQKTPPNESSLELKRRIEQNFVIPDNHYSQPILRIRKKRYYGMTSDEENDDSSKCYIVQALPLNEEPKLTTSWDFGPVVGESEAKIQKIDEVPSTSLIDQNYPESECDDDSSYSNGCKENESMVNINLDWNVIKQLQNTFDYGDVSYPLHIQPIISLPLNLLAEINAYWNESVTNQIESHEKFKEDLIKEDEDFAREIQREERELYINGREPGVPDFKEIMGLDLACSLHQKQLRDKTPDDLAAKMTKNKLFNLFPDFSKDVLTELLVAHDCNFKATVESLLMSTGRNKELMKENGLNKFLVYKELELQQKILKEKQKALEEVEWLLLPPGEVIDMSSVKRHRELAEQYLKQRTINMNKARDLINRRMTQLASHYSDVARFMTKQYEYHSSLAAAILMQLHASRCPNSTTIDLHFHRVAEAREMLDLFLDMHINKLKELQALNHGPRIRKLFFITGRGAHSQFGKAKVKPAVRKRLKERGLIVRECNPGLLSAQVTADDKLSYQVTPP